MWDDIFGEKGKEPIQEAMSEIIVLLARYDISQGSILLRRTGQGRL